MYGHLVHDNFVFVPNLFGFIISFVQLAVYMWIVGVLNPSALPDSETLTIHFKTYSKFLVSNLRKLSERFISKLVGFVKASRNWVRHEILMKMASASVSAEA